MKKYAICFGINNYPAPINPLRGCINDAKNVAKYLKDVHNFDDIRLLFDSDCTIATISKHLNDIINQLKPGDIFVWQNSSHGTSIIDKSDETGYDQAIVLYDHIFTDKEFRVFLDRIPKDVNTTLWVDSCFSGTVNRALFSRILGKPTKHSFKEPRFYPLNMIENNITHMNEIPLRSRFGIPIEAEIEAFKNNVEELNFNEVLLSACKADESSLDVFIDGENCGAFTYYALKILKENSIINYNQFHKKIKKFLPSRNYNQSPMTEGMKKNLAKIMFS